MEILQARVGVKYNPRFNQIIGNHRPRDQGWNFQCKQLGTSSKFIFTESGPRVESSKTNSWPQKPTPSWDLKTYQDNQDKDIGKFVTFE